MARRWSTGRIAWTAIIGAAVLFALVGGEYTTMDLIRQHRHEARIERQIDSLRVVIDSLEKELDAAMHDPATQERIAREEFGLVRGEREVLYRFAEPADAERR